MKRRRLESPPPINLSGLHPVSDLIQALYAYPSDTAYIAEKLSLHFSWNAEAKDIAAERLDNLRAQQLELIGRLQNMLPFDQSVSNLHIFMRRLQ